MKIIQVLVVFCLIQSSAFAFSVPERLEYNLSWIGIHAGTAVLSVRDFDNNYLIESRAMSNQYISSFYKVDDRVTCLVDKKSEEFGNVLTYRIRIREGSYRRDKEVIFDHAAQRLLYIDHKKNKKKEFDIEGNLYDPLSAFYAVRKKELIVGTTVYVKIFDSKKMWDVAVDVLRREKIEVPAGVFNTVVIRPNIRSEGVFQRKGDIYIWLTDDERKVPVLVKSEILIGHIAAELTGGTY